MSREAARGGTLGPRTERPRTGLARLLTEPGRRAPDRVAVVAQDAVLDAAELLRRGSVLAAALRARAPAPGQVVGVHVERSSDLVTAVLGTVLSGSVYLPLEPGVPRARLEWMAERAGVSTVVAGRGTPWDGPHEVVDLGAGPGGLGSSGGPDQVPGRDPEPDEAAYVQFTSGSTGRPKGVLNTHRGLLNRLCWMRDDLAIGPSDRILHKTPAGFDVSVWELLLPLAVGAPVVVAEPGGHLDAEYLAEVVRRHEVSVAHFVPSMLHLFLDHLEDDGGRGRAGGPALPSLRLLVCSGEQLSAAAAARVARLLPHVRLHNLYGPTEAAIDVTRWDCARPAPPGVLPIGFPVDNTSTYVLDDAMAESQEGELYLGGAQLALGYVADPGATAGSFVAHALAGHGGRLYRTGDRVRRLPGGALEFLGRTDQQVKIRGYRIELGEVEAVLREHPGVAGAAVVVREEESGPVLLARVTAAGPRPPEVPELRRHLVRHLPRHMLPASLEVVATLPLGPNGKLDRRALARAAPPD